MSTLLIYGYLPCSVFCFAPAGSLYNVWLNLPEFSMRILLFIALAFLLISIISQTRSLFLTRQVLKEKEQALEQIEKQKHELELRDKNLTDSLIYAQRIQEALLPSEVFFRKHFSDSFIFFRPKDIVSGDFYWIGEKGGKIFVVAADCTGHGVPGALMSMVGLEIIEKAILEDNIEKPSAILAVMNRALEKTFSREKNMGTIIRDGMDIGLCVIDRKKRKLEYSGAFFPLYLIRDNTLTELKGDKIIIGMNPERMEYTSHELDCLTMIFFIYFPMAMLTSLEAPKTRSSCTGGSGICLHGFTVSRSMTRNRFWMKI